MADKYIDLPDIDHDSKDVFETSDIESDNDIQTTVNETNVNSEIDNAKLDAKRSAEKFTNNIIVGEVDIVNFLGDLGTKSLLRSGYRVQNVVETVDQKMARIKRELEEIKLSQETAKDVVNENEHEELSNIDELVTLLESIDSHNSGPDHLNYYSEKLKHIFESINLDQDDTEPPSIELTEKNESLEILSLESRINDLETLLGSETLQELQQTVRAPKTKTVQNLLNDLKRKINIIYNPEFELGKIKQEIRELNRETEKLATNRKLAQLSSQNNSSNNNFKNNSPIDTKSHRKNTFEQKIVTIFDRLDEFDNVNKIIPSLLIRLKSLHKIHADLGNTVGTVGQLDQTLNDIKSDMVTWNASLDKVNENLDQQNQIFDTNRLDIEKRLQEAIHKVDTFEQKRN